MLIYVRIRSIHSVVGYERSTSTINCHHLSVQVPSSVVHCSLLSTSPGSSPAGRLVIGRNSQGKLSNIFALRFRQLTRRAKPSAPPHLSFFQI
jgi:hypothetical protein